MFVYFLTCSVLIGTQLVSTDKSHNIKDEDEWSMKTDEIQNVTDYFNNFLFMQTLPLDLTISDDITPQCRLHSTEYQRNVHKLTLWAIKMYDSNAKMQSGILNGNLYQFGDFDQCINTHSDDGNISGQYCLASIQIGEPNSKYLLKLYDLIHSHFVWQTDFNTPNHFGLRWSAIHWGLCVPSSCTHKDVELGLKIGLQSIMKQTGISIQVQVTDEMCQIAKRPPIPSYNIYSELFFVAFVGYILLITATDYYVPFPLHDLHGIQGILFAFSLRRTVKSLFSLTSSEGKMQTVHGLRFGEKGQPWGVGYRVISLYTDTFLMFSGFLTIYSYFGKANRGKSINTIEQYISRLLRIVPPLLAAILFIIFISPWLASGPTTGDTVGKHRSELCRKYWWRNLLFIQNYFGCEYMVREYPDGLSGWVGFHICSILFKCLLHTHSIGTDMQLFVLSPIFFWILWKWQKRGVIVLLTIVTTSTSLLLYVSYTNQVYQFSYFGFDFNKAFEFGNKLYVLPIHRATEQIIGGLLGYYLRTTNNVTLKPMLLYIGHATTIILFCGAFFVPAFVCNSPESYDALYAAEHTALVPILWCLSIAWIIFAEHFRYQNVLNKFFAWPGFRITSRLAYAIYLTQPIVLTANTASTRHSEYFYALKILINVHETCVVIFLAIILTLFFELPFSTIRRIIFPKDENETVEAMEDASDQSTKRIVDKSSLKEKST